MAYDRIDVPDRPLLHGLPIVAMAPVLMLLQDCALSGAPLAAPASDPTRGALEPVTTIRRMLASMAAPVPGHEPHQVGAGFVSDAIVKAWISSLRPAQLLRMLCGTEQAVPKRLSADEPVIGARLLGEIDRRRAGLGLIDRPIL